MPELAVVIDSFEQTVQRPADPPTQQGYYSGKKKMHTLKRQIGVDDHTGQMVDVSASVPSPTADMDLLDQLGLLARLPDRVAGLGDSAYPGIAKRTAHGYSPRKRPKGKPRPPEDVAFNHAFAVRSIVVENAIGRMRRYQAITQPDRHHRQFHAARVRAVAGLANRQIAHRLPC